jgi:hypothetical protein
MRWVEKFFGKTWGEKMTENTNLEDNLPLVNYIMLHRIYDVLTLIASERVGEEKINQLIDYHEQGFLLGPLPAFNPGNEE